jgi:hypothetical protein
MQRGRIDRAGAWKKGMFYDVADGVANTMLFLMIKERESTD